jgi:hypothetical protein
LRLNTKGDETYAVIVIDIATGNEVDTKIAECAGSVSWGADDNTLFYTAEDETKRPYKVYRHAVGTNQADDVLLYTDEDGQYYVGMGKSKSGKFLYIESGMVRVFSAEIYTRGCIPLGSSLLLPVCRVNCVQTLKVHPKRQSATTSTYSPPHHKTCQPQSNRGLSV